MLASVHLLTKIVVLTFRSLFKFYGIKDKKAQKLLKNKGADSVKKIVNQVIEEVQYMGGDDVQKRSDSKNKPR